jgi:hypothetical protein
LNTQRVLHWHLYIEEYGPIFHYVKGSDTVLANFLSQMPTTVEKRIMDRPNNSVAAVLTDNVGAHFVSLLDDSSPCFDCFQLSTKALECFVNLPQNPIAYPHIQQMQAQQVPLMALLQHDPVRYSLQQFKNSHLLCYGVPNQHNWRIYIPETLLNDLLQRYHNPFFLCLPFFFCHHMERIIDLPFFLFC